MKLLLPIAVVVGSIAVPAAAASAVQPPAGCGASKDLLTVEATWDRVDESIYSDDEMQALLGVLQSLDDNGNGDGLLCSKVLKPNKGQDKQWGGMDYPITQIWDNQPTGRSVVVP